MKAANETYTLIGRESPSILWKKTLLLPFTNFLFSMFAFALLLPSSLSPSLAVSSEFPNTLRVKTLPNDKLNLEFYSTFIIVLPSTYSILWVMRESITAERSLYVLFVKSLFECNLFRLSFVFVMLFHVVDHETRQ